ncbi:hypothetical protein BKA65DRAFT_490168 [Rhexocercosporidium sp. MPI-PUGE-AT-0058]|nr:hypothetical protein BKA65DRAFT_490168 [Rhexocercosporidium sp. MPI-PUGE-AT-0058]
MGPISSLVRPTHLAWTRGPVFDSEIRSGSFNGVDITMITDRKTFYKLDVDLNLIAEHDVSEYSKCDIYCHGYHSGVLVLGSEDGRIHILDFQRQKHNRISFSGQSISTISIDENHIMVGSFCGDIGLFDRSGRQLHGYRPEGGSFIHSVSMHDGKILAGAVNAVYLWEITNQELSPPTTFPLKSDYILWACLNKSGRKFYKPTSWITKPYIVGKAHRPRFYRYLTIHPPIWDHPCRPTVQENVPMRERYALIITTSALKVRNLKYGYFIQNFRFKEGREYVLMLWSAQKYVFRVIDGSKVIERAAIRTDNTKVNTSYFASVDLRRDDGP